METKKRGRPRKVQIQVSEAESDASTKSDISPKTIVTQEQGQEEVLKSRATKKLQCKHDHTEEVRTQQNARYQQIKDQLQLKRLCHTIFSDKFTDKQRAELVEELNQWKARIPEKQDVNSKLER